MIGEFKAKVIGAGYDEIGEKNTPQIKIKFEYGPENKTIEGKFFLSPLAQESTFEKLQKCGYLFLVNDFSDLIKGQGFDHDANFTIVIGEQKDKDGNIQRNKDGVAYEEVKFVNSAMKTIAPDQAVVKLKGLNIEGGIMAWKMKIGFVEKKIESEQIPF